MGAMIYFVMPLAWIFLSISLVWAFSKPKTEERIGAAVACLYQAAVLYLTWGMW